MLTRDVEHDPPLPGRSHGFATLQLAQALGDERALAARGRRVARVHLRGELGEGLAAFARALHAALERLDR
jgi:transaldolase/glucose-6-phosphate isomerase